MYAIELYVPRYDNQGQAIALEIWDGLESQIISHFRAFTRYAAVIRRGSQEEAITVYRVSSGNLPTTIQQAIEAIADWVKINWHQEFVLWTITETAEINFT